MPNTLTYQPQRGSFVRALIEGVPTPGIVLRDYREEGIVGDHPDYLVAAVEGNDMYPVEVDRNDVRRLKDLLFDPDTATTLIREWQEGIEDKSIPMLREAVRLVESHIDTMERMSRMMQGDDYAREVMASMVKSPRARKTFRPTETRPVTRYSVN